MKYAAEAGMWNEFSEDPYEIRDFFMDFVEYKTGYWKCIWVFLAIIIGFRIIAFGLFKCLVRKF